LHSLDAFRGATIAAMILVNNPGSWTDSFAQLKHAAWNGWTFTDMIFPFFLWIMGVAMTLSFAKRQEHGQAKSILFMHILRRSLILFALGILVNGFPFGLGSHTPFSFATLRIPGVLQRIAVCYLAAGLLMLGTGIRAQLWWTFGLLALYGVALKTIPVPGYGVGVMDPVGNLCWFVDSALLSGHTWSFAPAPGFDPEGIVSTVPAIATTLLGVSTGRWLGSSGSREEKVIWMFVGGYGLVLIGAIIDMWIPINKNMWTSSYTLFMGGWALVCFGTCFWLIDVKRYVGWSVLLRVFGMNAIVLYVVSELVGSILWLIPLPTPDGSAVALHDWIHTAILTRIPYPALASLCFALLFVLAMFLLGWVMWKKRIFVKV
jgi:predicted acyltransferase